MAGNFAVLVAAVTVLARAEQGFRRDDFEFVKPSDSCSLDRG